MSDSQPSQLSEKEATRYAQELAAQGRPPQEILRRLIERGVDRGIAHFIVTEKSGAVERVKKKAGRGHMLVGGIILGLGVVVTLFTYLTADTTTNNRFIVAYGAMFVGIAQLVRGFILSRSE
jgi:hypothetical protein